jgi:hypothetical protein
VPASSALPEHRRNKGAWASLSFSPQLYLRYYNGSRTHLALDKDAPEPRALESADHGRILALPLVGGLHHRYVRRAASTPASVLPVVREASATSAHRKARLAATSHLACSRSPLLLRLL